MFERFVERRAEEALSDTPVVLIVGPRRAGKTTLVRKMGDAGRTYITLDDQTVLEAARSDPAGFIRGLDRAIIDEIQRAPDLLLAIKKTVDEDYRPGRFLLTDSANVLTLPRVADSLAAGWRPSECCRSQGPRSKAGRQGGVRRRLAQGPVHENPRGGPDCLGENVGNGAARYSVRKTSMIVSWLKFTLRCIWRGILMPARMQ